MSYSINQYTKAHSILIHLYDGLSRGKKRGLPTPEQLKEPLRMAAEACCSLNIDIKKVEAVGRLIKQLYLDEQSVTTLNYLDVDKARDAVNDIMQKKASKEFLKPDNFAKGYR
jgi:hypothetical protein